MAKGGAAMIRMIAVVRTTVITAAFMAGVPTVLVALNGNPVPDQAPSAAQLQTWLADPLHPQYVPVTAWVMAWLLWALLTAIIFGNRTAGPIIAIVLTTFAIITVNVSEGIKSIPKDLNDMAKSFDVGVVKRNRHIVIPHLAPFTFTAVRFGFSIAWKVTVLTEVFSASQGIGFEMRTATQLFRLDEFLTWILAFYFVALFLDKVVLESIERRFFSWRGELKS